MGGKAVNIPPSGAARTQRSSDAFVEGRLGPYQLVNHKQQKVLPGQCRRWLVSGHPEGDDAISIPLFDGREHTLGGGGDSGNGSGGRMAEWWNSGMAEW
jgi:hypothetical protein